MAAYPRYFTEIQAIRTPFLPDEMRGDVRSPVATIHRRMVFVLGVVLLVIVPLLVKVLPGRNLVASGATTGDVASSEGTEATQEVAGPMAIPVPTVRPGGGIAPIFTPEVMYWESQLVAWSEEHGVDPNLAAIIMQIESCGDPQAASYAGAQGLFQVMPFHFAAGEDALDPSTNARRGLNYFAERLAQTNGDIGRAFAGYNGGHVAAASSWDQWAAETQRYYRWSTGIFSDIQSGLPQSPTVQDWLQAGGASLCRQAAQRLGLSS